MTIDMRHFLDEHGEIDELSPDASELLEFLSGVIVAASTEYGRPLVLAGVRCRITVDEKPCGGEVEVWVDAEDNRIGWECLECENEGVISHWEGTPWDKRSYTRQ